MNYCVCGCREKYAQGSFGPHIDRPRTLTGALHGSWTPPGSQSAAMRGFGLQPPIGAPLKDDEQMTTEHKFPGYDWRADQRDDLCERLRSGQDEAGVVVSDPHPDTGKTYVTWGCRCGAWAVGHNHTEVEMDAEYEQHQTFCPIKQNLVWNGGKWVE